MKTCGDNGGRTKSGEPCSREVESGRCHDHEIDTNSTMPKTPEHFGPEANWLWHEVGPMLQEWGYLEEIDLPLYEQACETYGLARNSYKTIQEEGRTVTDHNHGGIKRHPEMLNYKQMSEKFEKLTSKLGMNPNSRSQISLPEPSEEQPSDLKSMLD